MRKKIKGLTGYEVNEDGEIRNKKTGLIRKTFIASDGYKTIDIWGNRYKVHRLVAETFIPNPNKYKEVNHIDSDKTNAKVENLEWVTPSQNILHSRRSGFRKYKNEDKRKAVVGYNKDGEKIYEFASLSEAARVLGLSRGDIGNVCRGVGKTHGGIIRKFANDIGDFTD